MDNYCFHYAIVTILTFCSFVLSDVITVSPSGPLIVASGSTLTFNCTVNVAVIPPDTMHWDYGQKRSTKVTIRKLNDNTLQLQLSNIDGSDSGMVSCKGENMFGHTQYKSVVLTVVSAEVASLCSARTQYRCDSGECIFLQFRCDNIAQCKDSSDERGCDKSCGHGFLCNNGRCIDTALVCDKFHTNNCGDWSDEQCSINGPGNNQGIVTTDDEDWIPMTVYIVVGCVLTLAVVVAVLVVAAFRIRMKQALARRYNAQPGDQLMNYSYRGRASPILTRTPFIHRLAAYDVDSGHSDDDESRPVSLELTMLPTDDPNMPRGDTPPPPYVEYDYTPVRFTGTPASVRSRRLHDTDESDSLPLGADFASSGFGTATSDSPMLLRTANMTCPDLSAAPRSPGTPPRSLDLVSHARSFVDHVTPPRSLDLAVGAQSSPLLSRIAPTETRRSDPSQIYEVSV